MQRVTLVVLSDFAAVDVETANNFRRSICEIAVATADDQGMIVCKSWLIQPPANRYDEENSAVHGITAADTKDSPRFKDAWTEVQAAIGDRHLIAHNAPFDADCIGQALSHYKITDRLQRVACTLRIADLVLKDRIGKFTLKALCEDHSIPLNNAHRAEADAEATLRLAVKLFELSGEHDFNELVKRSNRGHEARRERNRRNTVYASTDPPTEKQLNYLRRLLDENGYRMPFNDLTKGTCSKAIDDLQNEKKPAGATTSGRHVVQRRHQTLPRGKKRGSWLKRLIG